MKQTGVLKGFFWAVVISLPLLYGCPPEVFCPDDQDFFEIYSLRGFQVKVSNKQGLSSELQSKFISHQNIHSILCPLDINQSKMSYEIIQNDSSFGVFSIHYGFGELSCQESTFKQVDTATIDSTSTFLKLYSKMYGYNGKIIVEGRIDSVGHNIAAQLANLYAKLD